MNIKKFSYKENNIFLITTQEGETYEIHIDILNELIRLQGIEIEKRSDDRVIASLLNTIESLEKVIDTLTSPKHIPNEPMKDNPYPSWTVRHPFEDTLTTGDPIPYQGYTLCGTITSDAIKEAMGR